MLINLEPNEKVVIAIRKHWFHIFMKAFGLFLVLVIVVGGVYLLNGFSKSFIQLEIQGNTAALWITFISIFVFLSWISFFSFWTKYYLDYWLITDRRVIDMELVNFFSENIAIMHLDDIEDITVEIKGLFAHIFGFGTLHVQSAGATREFMIKNVANPNKLKDQIFQLQYELREKPQKVEVVDQKL